ncbi:hypothetical protein NIES4106_01650 [Fischerella sp. NIES-4106]|nr:hypothetical protein NIES4106_01650 [Fischerella sp. NIES-4106]
MNKPIKNLKLAFDDWGVGETTIILLPGWCSDRGILTALAKSLTNNRRVINLDLLGHNESDYPEGDFGSEDIVYEVLKIIDSLDIHEFSTVSVAHAGWIALELRRRLFNRLSKMIFLEWILIEPPSVFFKILESMQKPNEWQNARDNLFHGWSLGDSDLIKPFQEFMTNYDFDMWSRAGREIEKSYKKFGNALKSLETIIPTPTVLSLYSPAQVKNLYAQPDDSSYFEAQQNFAKNHPWFHFRRLSSKSHLPSVEVTQDVAHEIEYFMTNN